jgi:hypothetical protein
MPFVAVLALLLLLIAALGQSWWCCTAAPWYGNASFCWGVFFLALYLTWPTIRALL